MLGGIDNGKSDENATSGDFVGKDRIGNVQRIKNFNLDTAVKSAEINEVELVLRLAGRHLRIVRVIEATGSGHSPG